MTTGPLAPHAPHKRPRRDRSRLILIAVLAISLAGNALAIGAVARFQNLRHDLLDGSEMNALFPRPERRALLDAMRENADQLRPELRSLVEARAGVVAAGMARPFDRGALDAAMAEFRTEADRLLNSLQQVIGDTLEARATSPRS